MQGDGELALGDVHVDARDEEVDQVLALFGDEHLPDLGEAAQEVEGALHPTHGDAEPSQAIVELAQAQPLLVPLQLDLGEAVGDGAARLAGHAYEAEELLGFSAQRVDEFLDDVALERDGAPRLLSAPREAPGYFRSDAGVGADFAELDYDHRPRSTAGTRGWSHVLVGPRIRA